MTISLLRNYVDLCGSMPPINFASRFFFVFGMNIEGPAIELSLKPYLCSY